MVLLVYLCVFKLVMLAIAEDFMELKQEISSNCDRCILYLLCINFLETGENHLECSQIQLIAQQFQQSLIQQATIHLTEDGQVKFITPTAKELLQKYFLCHNIYALPEILQRWFKQQISQLQSHKIALLSPRYFCMEQEKSKLIIKLIPNSRSSNYLLLLEEQEILAFSITTLELLGLTKREAEVLYWISKDKSNARIAKILGCGEGTVRKHLEHIYEKLDVQTRTGAVMVALEKLGLIKG